MIFSDRQYTVSKEQLFKLQAALAAVKADMQKHERLRKIEINALQSQVEEISSELADYDLLRSGSLSFSESYALSDLPRVLIQARIARGLSQSDLAAQLNLKPQQIQRYEATNYMSASLARLIEIADALRVRVSQSFSAAQGSAEDAIFSWGEPEDVDWTRFPLKEMAKRGWLQGRDLPSAAKSYFLQAAGPQFVSALHRKKVRGGGAPNEFALLAWQARILEIARAQSAYRQLEDFVLSDAWVPDLVALTKVPDGPRQAREFLFNHGIALVFERHLTNTYLDGAAMISPEGYPIIALTLRHDRLDNFWFVLFHELGHVFLHLFTSMRLDFFDEEDGENSEGVEREADVFALDRLIPEALWKQCLSRFALTEEAVRIDAERLGVDPSIIAGRIRKERKNYLILNDLIGAGTVRAQLEEGKT